MSLLYPPQDIHDAIVAAQAEASTVPLRDSDTDDETIKPRPRSGASEVFEGFGNFELDLSCLSRPSSPVPSSSYHLPPSTPSPPPSLPPSLPPSPPPVVQHTLSRTRSFAQQAMAPLKKSVKKTSSSHLPSLTLPPTRGSWQGMKYTGRGTPIDRNRAREWGNLITEEDEVAEDGVLFSTAVRSASLDSHARPSQRSLSPEWNYLPALLSGSSSQAPEDDEQQQVDRLPVVCEPPPALEPINIGSDQSDWASIMETVLGSSKPQSSHSDTIEDTASTHVVEETVDSAPTSEADGESVSPSTAAAALDTPLMTPDQIQELHTGLESHLGIHQALDLGLGIHIPPHGGGGRMNLFKLGLLPSSASGRETPSIYSQAETPRASRAPTILFHGERPGAGDDLDQRSVTSTKAEVGAGVAGQVGGGKSEDQPWWRKVLRGMRRIQETINTHKRRFQ